jgi:hypothetical protein
MEESCWAHGSQEAEKEVGLDPGIAMGSPKRPNFLHWAPPPRGPSTAQQRHQLGDI